jgi:osmotically-inducible protein OsmY
MKTKGFLLAVFFMAGTMLAAAQSSTAAANSPTGQSSASQQTPSSNSASTAGAPEPASPDSNNNAGLQSRINDALRNEPTLGASHVTASVSESDIDLTGTVGSVKDKQTAERIASSFDGNRKLTDNITVTGAGHSDLDPKHPAMNNGGVGNTPNPAMNNGTNNPPKQ